MFLCCFDGLMRTWWSFRKRGLGGVRVFEDGAVNSILRTRSSDEPMLDAKVSCS
jgi:hypothetical protein